jgi:cytochrome c oxidase subunit 1
MSNYLNHTKGVKSWLTTLDHKRIGLLYLFTVLLFFFVGGLFAMAIRLEHWTAGQTVMTAATYNKVFTFHGVIMVFLVIIPAIPGILGNFVLPIMLGAKDVAFPRLNLLSYYLYILGAIIALCSVAFGGIDTGWTFYTPYSLKASTGVIFVVFGAFLSGFGGILTALNFIVTIHKLRAPGLTWGRLPLFVWASYATSVIQILATPVLAITLLLIIAERVLKIGIFDPALGGDAVLFQHFFWFYSHPAVYIMILPAMGIISEIFPVWI